MNPSMKSCIGVAISLLGLQAAVAQSCDNKPERAERRVVYEVVRPQPEVRIVEVTERRERSCRVEYSTTVVQQTTVYNVVTVAQSPPPPREPHVRYSYVSN